MLFLSFFDIAFSYDALVADVWIPLNGGCWVPWFCRRINDWEMKIVASLIRRLQGWRVKSEEEDKLVWKGGKSEEFSIKSLY